MLTLILSRSAKGTEIQITSPDFHMARKVYTGMLRASLRVDQCTKTLFAGNVANGSYSYLIHVPGLDYEYACRRIAEIWPEATIENPLALIGG